mmetsp:Transcript_53376/g.95800  ORF Transcript_53376/g.95800 Transcript_53376/m.95800 type:complete len:191 (-) Transcript_53376:31-603(-)
MVFHVTFRVMCDSTRPGDAIYVVGAPTALGSWYKELAVPLYTSPEEWPMWSSEPIELHMQGKQVEYKFLIRPQDDREPDEWEEFHNENNMQGNHVLTPLPGTHFASKSFWGSSNVQVEMMPYPAKRRSAACLPSRQFVRHDVESLKKLPDKKATRRYLLPMLFAASTLVFLGEKIVGTEAFKNLIVSMSD